ncbi:hypothetical protein [Blastococcus haudaquaticus]|uniref:PknH-like extracellular domain-containing protein n=1 Tax=Blastococcus haudaquaticus TaxID=1938745 RepID=A0A286GW10_9ACTN|nr:hypothetical protein [Blastococcus haudaquaticus]SOD99269.1 hypothetical protein SAMN06272739_2226 [Blastococcus haudaquaticus]
MRLNSRTVRSALALTAVLALGTACGGGDEQGEEAAATTASSSSAEETPAPDLASGLLPAEAFGADATVVAISPEQLAQGAGLAASGAEGLQVTPEECAVAVEGTQPKFEDFDDVAAQSATGASATTVEMLVRGGPTKDAVAQLATAGERCPQAQVTSPSFGQAIITFEQLPVDDLGDGAALLRYTTAVSAPDGSSVTVPALIGAVEDGDRLLLMMSLETSALSGGAAAAPADPAAFADLLAQAYEAQAEALD